MKSWLVLLAFFSPLVWGEDKTTPPLSYAHLSTGPGYLEAAASLLLVLGMIIGLAWVTRRFGLTPIAKGNAVRIIGGVSLSSRERAVLLEVEGKRILVGVAPGQVTPLLQLDDETPVPQTTTFAQDLKLAKEKATIEPARGGEAKS